MPLDNGSVSPKEMGGLAWWGGGRGEDMVCWNGILSII